jgi:hypothetical protein
LFRIEQSSKMQGQDADVTQEPWNLSIYISTVSPRRPGAGFSFFGKGHTSPKE